MTQMTHKCPECGTYYTAEQECDWDGVQTVRAPDPQGFVTWDLPPQNRHGEAGTAGMEAMESRHCGNCAHEATHALAYPCRSCEKHALWEPTSGVPVLHGEPIPPSAEVQEGGSDGR